MTRVHLPADHDHGIYCYRRHSSSAFLCNADEAVAMSLAGKKWPKKLLRFSIAVISIAFLALVIHVR